ncbi:hypothetical protein AVEN_68098-1 [Araneus ventricosus]|uniref:Uncharacterized protein n=1 Tax=Araneus ventricosus TaxID=182803 RepID=A0A4Y2IZS5_ARAVE|nr:hypothetical protein AVEN_68098-1 [Araneus ventricosus]
MWATCRVPADGAAIASDVTASRAYVPSRLLPRTEDEMERGFSQDQSPPTYSWFSAQLIPFEDLVPGKVKSTSNFASPKGEMKRRYTMLMSAILII